MNQPAVVLKRPLIENALRWFLPHFRQQLVTPIESEFPNWPLTREIQEILDRAAAIERAIQGWPGSETLWEPLFETLSRDDRSLPPLFKRIILLYRRHRAAETERLTEKTFHLELTDQLAQDVKALDALTATESFARLEEPRLPRLKDFLPVQYIEAAVSQLALPPRQHDEKFHILQAPQLFLLDMAHFRAKCEDRDTPLAIAFLDIDDFKPFNTRYKEITVDRNLLPRFMQTIESHVFHHGFAYRQGGDEYLILVPSFSRPLSIAFVDELRRKLADLSYPDIAEKTTVSIGLCIVHPECALTDRELLDRANRAKEFAKQKGKNRIVTYSGVRFVEDELEVVQALE